MSKFRSLNNSKASMQSVIDNEKDILKTSRESVQERKQFAFNKFNVNGENQRGDDLERSKNQNNS
jgi:hypothetical protein